MTLSPKSFGWTLDDDGVATITLSRPDRINALTFEIYAELRDTFRALKDDEDPAVRHEAAAAERVIEARLARPRRAGR